jgi:hypothetical protein
VVRPGHPGRDPNLYRYCGNDPVNATDPSGLASFGAWVGGGLAAGAVVFCAVIGAPVTVPAFGVILLGAAIGSALESPGDDPVGMVSDAVEVTTFITPATQHAALVAPALVAGGVPRIGPGGGGPASLPPGGSGGTIYRSGKTNPGNLTVRPGETAISFRDSLTNPIDPAGGPTGGGAPCFGLVTRGLALTWASCRPGP